MALKITLVICATILLLFIIVLLILSFGAVILDKKEKLNDDDVARLQKELEKEKAFNEAKSEEIKKMHAQILGLRRKYNDMTLFPGGGS